MIRIAFMLLTLLATTQSLAQSQAIDVLKDVATLDEGTRDADAEAPRDRTRWRIAVGAGSAVFPTFSGSEDHRAGFAPFAKATYGRFFAGTGGLGYDIVNNRTWRLNVHLTGGRGRRESDDERLTGLGDIDATLRGGLTARYSIGRFAATAQVFSDLLGKDQGTLARVDLVARFAPTSRLILVAGPGGVWANRVHSQTYYGVNTTQQANSDYAAFQADAGINSVHLSATGIYIFTRNWIGIASAATARLQGDAARSPFVDSRSQNMALVAASYVF